MAHNSWDEEELYSRLPLKPPVETAFRRYLLIGIGQTGRPPKIAKKIEVLLRVNALGEMPAQDNFHDFNLLLAKPELWPTKGCAWNNIIISARPEPGYTPVMGVLPELVLWWPKGGLEVELFDDYFLDGDPFQGTPFEKAKEGIARLIFNIHIDTNITQKGAYLTKGGFFVKDRLQAVVAFELDGLSEYLGKRD